MFNNFGLFFNLKKNQLGPNENMHMQKTVFAERIVLNA